MSLSVRYTPTPEILKCENNMQLRNHEIYYKESACVHGNVLVPSVIKQENAFSQVQKWI